MYSTVLVRTPPIENIPRALWKNFLAGRVGDGSLSLLICLEGIRWTLLILVWWQGV